MLWLLLPGVALAALGGVAPISLWLAIAWDLAVALAVVLDTLALSRVAFNVERASPETTMRRSPVRIDYRVEHDGPRELAVRLLDRFADAFEPREFGVELRVAPRSAAAHAVTLTVARRGRYALQAPVVWVAGALGLVRRRLEARCAAWIDVIPDLRSVGRFEALRRLHRLHEMGIARSRERGQGTEIDGLRPWAQGDPYSAVSWKSSAKRGRPVVREMNVERRQNLLLLIDCGRRMARQIDGRSRLDHAVEAALLLAHVALRSDDRVGLVAFGESIEKVVPPVWGVTQLRALARAVHALSPTLREPPYEALAASVLSRFSRRSLVVLFSDAAEPSSIDSFVPAVRALSRKHLVVCAIFRDEYIERARGEAIVDENQLFLAGAAAELQVERDRSLLRLSRGGALVVEAPAEALSTHVVNRYLDVRARHLL